MKIISIFAPHLYAVQYDGQQENELQRLLETWQNTDYLRSFLNANKKDFAPGETLYQILDRIISESFKITDTLLDIVEKQPVNLDQFFQTLDDNETYIQALSLQKRKQKYLRLYAVRIEKDLFVITGGVIKLPGVHKMQDRAHLQEELAKIKTVKHFLNENGVADEDSFFEYYTEN